MVGFVSGYAPAALATDSVIYMQSATINAAADAVTLRRVPVRDANGLITYKDVSLLFDVDTSGNVTLDTASVKITPSPILAVGAFKPGTYRGYKACSPSPCKTAFTVGSPGIGTGGRISGSIQRINTYGAYDVFNASWTSGPIKGHPDEALLKAAGITSTTHSWGVMGTAGPYTQSSGWHAGDIVGVVQTGDQLSIQNFGNDNIPDSALTFDLCPTANPC